MKHANQVGKISYRLFRLFVFVALLVGMFGLPGAGVFSLAALAWCRPPVIRSSPRPGISPATRPTPASMAEMELRGILPPEIHL